MMMAPYGTKASVAEKIVAESRISGGELKIERVTELIGPLADGLNDSVKTLHRMIKEEGDWRFNLGDGISVKVNFSADPSKACERRRFYQSRGLESRSEYTRCRHPPHGRGRGMRPLVIELFCGRFGWSKGFVAEGYRSIGFDIVHEDHHGAVPEHCELVLQDVLTLHGSQFRDAVAIVASPPCQAYSYRAMPWKRAKALPPPSNELFDACFRIQREANEANCCAPNGDCMDCDGTGNWYHHDEDGDFLPCDACGGLGARRYIPMMVENVVGAQRWVGPAKWHHGSMYLWGDVPALMPHGRALKQPGDTSWFYSNYETSARRFGSKSKERKEFSARAAEIPLDLAEHIARCFKPSDLRNHSERPSHCAVP